MFDKDTYSERRSALAKRTGEKGIIALQGNTFAPINYTDNTFRFRQDSDFLYFTGISRPDLCLLIDLDDGSEHLVGHEITMDDIIWTGAQPSLSELAASCGIDSVMDPAGMSRRLQEAHRNGRPVHILPPYRKIQNWNWMNWFDLPWSEAGIYVSEALVRAIVSLRAYKSPEEIEQIHEAVNITGAMHLAAMRETRAGMKEVEISGRLNGIAASGGGDLSFPIILSRDGQILHNHYHGNILEEGDLLLVDCGAENEMGYAGDMTRTFPVSASFSDRQRDIYSIVLASQEKAISMLRPGISYREVHLAACAVIAEGLRDQGILRGSIDDIVNSGAHALFMPHGLGHMMGLDVHDMEGLGEDLVGYNDKYVRNPQFGLRSLRLGRELEPGFVLTVEPGIYFIPDLIAKWKEEGHCSDFIDHSKLADWYEFGGIRIEEDFHITSEGADLLGDPVAKTIEDVEEIRRQAVA